MDVKKLYEEQMKKFFDLSNACRDAVYVIFPHSKVATLDDLHDARLLADKQEEIKTFLDGLLSQKNTRFNEKARTRSI